MDEETLKRIIKEEFQKKGANDTSRKLAKLLILFLWFILSLLSGMVLIKSFGINDAAMEVISGLSTILFLFVFMRDCIKL